MFRIGTLGDSSRQPGSRAFARPQGRRPSAIRWIAALPLFAVASITFNAGAPAEVSLPDAAAAAQQVAGRWSIENARTLLSLAAEAAQEGLDPTLYGAEALGAAIESGQTGATLDVLATATALRLAHDYADGRIENKQALDWHIRPDTDPNRLAAELDGALDAGRLAPWLRGLLPDNDQYRALKAAYAQTADSAMRDQLRANLERWRWMPRDLGDRYIYVNVPSYRLSFMNEGVEEARYNVVVGSPRTPTPQLALEAQSVVANPSWTVPQSIIKAGGLRGKGYSWKRRADGSVSVQQAPGPGNALGRIKIDMPNPHAIYLHDTPNRTVFDRENRALSHGCVRVQNIEELAALLQGGAGLDEALADPHKTVRLQLQKSVPVYLVYFTLQADANGTIRFVGDPYQRDRALLSQLGRMKSEGATMALRMAAR